jgi:hypothetical protein
MTLDANGNAIQPESDAADANKTDETPAVDAIAESFKEKSPETEDANKDVKGDEQKETDSTDEIKSPLPGGDEHEKEEAAKDDAETDKEGDDKEADKGELKGAPEKYDDFDISSGKDIGYAMSDEQKTAFIEFGKEANLDQKQMNAILTFHITKERQAAKASEAFIESFKSDGIKASRKEFGDKYDAARNKNSLVYSKFFNEEARTKLNDMGISSQPWFFSALDKISSVISEDVTVPGDNLGVDPSKRRLEDFFKDKPL